MNKRFSLSCAGESTTSQTHQTTNWFVSLYKCFDDERLARVMRKCSDAHTVSCLGTHQGRTTQGLSYSYNGGEERPSRLARYTQPKQNVTQDWDALIRTRNSLRLTAVELAGWERIEYSDIAGFIRQVFRCLYGKLPNLSVPFCRDNSAKFPKKHLLTFSILWTWRCNL